MALLPLIPNIRLDKKDIIPKITSGVCYFAIGMSEPDSGSDLASVKTNAE